MDSESKLRFVQEVLDVDHIFGLGGKHFHRKKHVFRFLIKNGWELFGHFLQKLVNFEFSFYNNPISGKVWWAFQIFDKFFVLTTICPLKMGLNIPKIPNFTIYTGKRSCSFFYLIVLSQFGFITCENFRTFVEENIWVLVESRNLNLHVFSIKILL